MAWNLEIHHIDVGQGDSTLIIAREVGGLARVRSCLIDGGVGDAGTGTVHPYITGTAGLTNLDIMVATHYDKDHYGGLKALLKEKNETTYDKVYIFDQGDPGDYYGGGQKRADGVMKLQGQEADYLRYVEAINMKHPKTSTHPPRNRTRVTWNVMSFKSNTTDYPGWYPGWWLIDKEILWYDYLTGIPAGAPTIKCIAANQYVLKQDGTYTPHASSGGVDPKNEKSLAFLIEFNNFKYYIGGDIESAQEDGSGADGIMHYLNQTNTDADRVHAMKCSHHGSHHSTSRGFLNRVRPLAAFISCGEDNLFVSNSHPTQNVINILEGFDAGDYRYETSDPHPDPNYAIPVNIGPAEAPEYRQAPPLLGAVNPNPYHCVENYYMTSRGGYHHSYLGSGADVVAGAPGPPIVNGNIVLKVDQNQSTGTGVPTGEFNVEYFTDAAYTGTHP
jgi:beta-lactamase superfamily II metal-dependent hydrolase